MAIDISGKTFDSRHNYSELISMQGRVVSDTPLNEGAAIVDRRFRAESIDLAGFSGYPAHLPDSFRIDVSGGELRIHPGRYYVDGLMAENFGHGDHEFYLPLEELRSDEPVPFQFQPYLPILEPLDLEDGRYLAFLDVWKRPVTFLEDPDLIDPAIGVDTSARMQTVWQVKLFAVDDGVTCNTDDDAIEGWEAFTEASGARLTTRANAASAVNDPCRLPPEGGYRGLENRTYMVAVHDVNEDGLALLKWSQVNAAFAGKILAQPANNTLTLEQVAKDDYLRFSAGDWAEITDDVRVLEGNPGSMVRILSVNDATNTIVLENPLAVGEIMLVPASTAANQSIHPILRRWDQSGVVLDSDGNEIVNLDAPDSEGLIPAPEGVFIALEDGVEAAIDLDAAGGDYHVGDNWSFVTRYADSSVEVLTDAPPQAFHHHYCRLAVVDVSEGEFVDPVFQDCRDPIGTAGCCTVVVRPGEDIQAALDSLSPEFGGCVCLKVGVHTIHRPLVIRYSNVTLHGESHGAQILNLSNDSAILVRSDDDSRLSGIHLSMFSVVNRGGTEMPQGIVSFRSVDDSVMEDCRVFSLDGITSGFGNPAIALFDCERVRVTHCTLEGAPIGVWMDDDGQDLVVQGNVISYSDEQLSGLIGVAIARLTGRVRVLDNDIDGFVRGVVVNNDPVGAPFSTAAHSEVKGNRITLGRMAGELDAVAVECNCANGTVSENQITLLAEDSIGVMVRGVGTLVERNRIETEEQIELQVAILVGSDSDLFSGGITVAQNWIRGCNGGVVAERVAGLRVDNNDISGDGGTELAVSVTECDLASVENNAFVNVTVSVFASQCEDIQIISNQILEGGIAITCERCTRVDISNNQISNCTHGGIVLLLCIARAGVIANRLNYVGSAAQGIFVSSIMALFQLGECHVESNEVLNTGVGEDEVVNSQAAVGIGALFVLEARIESNLVSYSDLLTRQSVLENRALLMQGLFELSFPISDRRFVLLGYAAQVANNKFLGSSADTMVQIRSSSLTDNIRFRFERVLFNNNFIEHVGNNDDNIASGATVILNGHHASVMGNHVKSGTFFLPSFDFNNMPGPYIGNVVRGTVINHPEFPSPESSFNTQA
ncbi:right-handed parallel beta-helix repeat-containing protein [Enterovibrio sp. ZSDZ35]|uniref:Right-handed parallel beta-helix repeat-containing protein n=1 Tax=Enterovibrio qingdaonensis TaxID=2899818 RepID=A0ABT5QJ32_9GAMM|nr:DUF6519 domain-containing protein [Enterovibrio sp. ZSDZ35]MDD1780480.1 right-handed parallel beta-helix repeat-containing protein [Enterovibrio sp. ZSDZ35]